MKTLYLSLFALFTVMIGANAQSALVDLSSSENYELYRNNEQAALDIVDVSLAPAGMPVTGVTTEKILKLTSNDLAEWVWWYNTIFKIMAPPAIGHTHNVVNLLIYTNSSLPMQFIIKDDLDQPIYAWEQPLEPNTWHTLSFDLSDPVNDGRVVGSIEPCPGASNLEAYIFPYWGPATTYDAREYVPVFDKLSDIAGDIFWTYNNDKSAGSIVDIPAEIKAGLPVATDEVFMVETSDIGDWWWNSRLNFSSYVEITEEKPYLSCFVYSPNYLTNLYVRNQNMLEGPDLGQNMYIYPNYNQFEIEANEWSEIKFDFTGKVGQSISQFEMLPRTANTKYYFYPVWQKKAGQSNTVKTAVDQKYMPVIIGGDVVLQENAEIQLFNSIGQLVNSTYGTTIPAVKGLNIVLVNGISYKLMNK